MRKRILIEFEVPKDGKEFVKELFADTISKLITAHGKPALAENVAKAFNLMMKPSYNDEEAFYALSVFWMMLEQKLVKCASEEEWRD